MGAVELPVRDSFRIRIYIFGIPSSPQGWVAVNIYEIVVIPDDMHHDGLNKISDTLLLLFIQLQELIHQYCYPQIGGIIDSTDVAFQIRDLQLALYTGVRVCIRISWCVLSTLCAPEDSLASVHGLNMHILYVLTFGKGIHPSD